MVSFVVGWFTGKVEMFETIDSREVGPYVVHELIGWSAMSRVYRATDTSRDDAEVAFKVLADSMANDPERKRRFLREIEFVSGLDHPHILPIIDYGFDDGLFFMVTSMVSAGTLADRLRDRGPLTPRQTAMLATQIGSAIDHAHSLGMMHRDVKPGNIMITSDEHYSLADFGLVKRVGEASSNQPGMTVGSPLYASPEQARGEDLDERTDLYSFGMVLYECLVRRLPFTTRTMMEALRSRVMSPPLAPSAVSPDFPRELEAVLLKSICADPDARYQSGGALAEAMIRAITSLPDPLCDTVLVSAEAIQSSSRLFDTPNVIPQSDAECDMSSWSAV